MSGTGCDLSLDWISRTLYGLFCFLAGGDERDWSGPESGLDQSHTVRGGENWGARDQQHYGIPHGPGSVHSGHWQPG